MEEKIEPIVVLFDFYGTVDNLGFFTELISCIKKEASNHNNQKSPRIQIKSSIRMHISDETPTRVLCAQCGLSQELVAVFKDLYLDEELNGCRGHFWRAFQALCEEKNA